MPRNLLREKEVVFADDDEFIAHFLKSRNQAEKKKIPLSSLKASSVLSSAMSRHKRVSALERSHTE